VRLISTPPAVDTHTSLTTRSVPPSSASVPLSVPQDRMPPRSRWSSRAARAPAGEPFAPTTTLGDLIDHFGERASLPDILRAAVLPKSDLPRLQIERRIITEEPWTRRQIHWVRWFYVCQGFDLNKGWSGAFDHAAEVPVGSAAEGGPDAMETS
jgi:hypothetical protein